MRIVPTTSLAALLLVAAPAAADWQNTHWGDSVKATIAALGGDTVKVKGRSNERVFAQDFRARGTGTFDGVAVEREFYFDRDGGLSVVKLMPKGEDCDAFIAAVRKGLGPARTARSRTLGRLETHGATWNDQAANLAILMFDVRAPGSELRLCHLIYQPYGDGTPGMRGPDGRTLPLPEDKSTGETDT